VAGHDAMGERYVSLSDSWYNLSAPETRSMTRVGLAESERAIIGFNPVTPMSYKK
jgi:hypothetical protein